MSSVALAPEQGWTVMEVGASAPRVGGTDSRVLAPEEGNQVATPKHRTAPGVSYFVTTKSGQGRAIFRVAENAERLVKTIFDYRDSGAFFFARVRCHA